MTKVRPNKTDTDKLMKNIAHVIASKKAKDSKLLNIRFKRVFDIILNFIIKKKLIIYGGVALNYIVPFHDRFYNKDEIPDIDFFTYDSLKHAKELADELFKSGFKYVEVKRGIHYETFKIYVDFVAVADITNIPKSLFLRMKRIAESEKKRIREFVPKFNLPIAPFHFLRLALHLELSRPRGYIERWKKIFYRMTLLYDYYPLDLDKKCITYRHERNKRLLEIRDYLLLVVKDISVPILGFEAIKTYVNEENKIRIPQDSIIHPKMTLFDIVSLDYKKIASIIKTKLHKILKEDEKIVVTFHSALNDSELLPRHLIIYIELKGILRPLIGIYKSEACYSYKNLNGYKFASIDTLSSFMYAWLLAERSYLDYQSINCLITLLLHVQYMHLHQNNYKYKMFEHDCYGNQKELYDIKKMFWNKRKDISIYRPKKI